jgi:Protein of unknown function DUF262
MSPAEPAPPRVRPEIPHIETLFQEIEAGELRIPRFQRPFVWKPENMIALFDSIRRGYPIGSLLIWETDQDLLSHDYIGPLHIPPRTKNSTAYILDGQQRLSTLYGVLRLGADFPKGPSQQEWQWWIYYDLEERRFLHGRGAVAPELLPLRAILRTADFLKEARRLSIAFGETKGGRLTDEGQSLAQRLMAQEIAVIRIRGGTLEQAVEIFSRLNTTGQKMTPDQMISALTYREGVDAFDLAAQIDQIMEGLDGYNFGSLSRTVVFQKIVVDAGFNVHTTASEQLVRRLRDGLGQVVVDAAGEALFKAVTFLVDELRVPGDHLLPYARQFLFLAEFFSRCPTPTPSPTQAAALRKWFWATSFSGWFASANPTEIRLALDEFRVLAAGQGTELVRLKDPCRPFPKTFDLHSARLRTFILVMMQRLKPRNLIGEELDAKTLFFEHGGRAFLHVFRNLPADLATATANRVLLPARRGQPVRKQLLGISPDVRDAVLRSHGINDAAWAALVADNAVGFVQARARHLAQIERDFLAELGLTAPTEELGESDIDTDDDD